MVAHLFMCFFYVCRCHPTLKHRATIGCLLVFSFRNDCAGAGVVPPKIEAHNNHLQHLQAHQHNWEQSMPCHKHIIWAWCGLIDGVSAYPRNDSCTRSIGAHDGIRKYRV